MMKKMVSFSFIAAMVFTLPSIAAAAQKCGRVISVIGQAQTKRLGKQRWEKMVRRKVLYDDSRVRTGRNSTLKLKLFDGSIIKLGQTAVFDLKKVAAKKNQKSRGLFKVWFGKIRATVVKVRKKKSDYKFHTPTAVAGVRGTDLGIQVKGKEEEQFMVFQGEIAVEKKEKPDSFADSETKDKPAQPTPPKADEQKNKVVIIKANQKVALNRQEDTTPAVQQIDPQERKDWDFDRMSVLYKSIQDKSFIDTKKIYRDDRRF